MTTSPLPPHNIEAEEAILGSLLIDPDAIIKVAFFLSADDFYIVRNGWMYQAVVDLHENNKPTNLISLCDELERRNQLNEFGGPVRLTELMNLTPTSVYIESYAHIVERTAVLRRIIEASGKVARLAYRNDERDLQEITDEVEATIFKVTSTLSKTGPQHIKEIVETFYDKLEYLQAHPDASIGVPTGISDLDLILGGGLQKTDMIVLGGRPGQGKSALATSIALKTAKNHQKKIAIFSLEMSNEQLIQRLIAAETGISSQRLRSGDIQEEEWSDFIKATDLLSRLSILIDDTPAISVLELRTKVRRIQAEHGLDLLIVDYLQLMRPGVRKENRQQEISYISDSIKALAKELNIPILALSQLSRELEKRRNKVPRLSDLRESGSLEQNADIVMFIYRDELYNPDTEFPNIAQLFIEKQRNGPTGSLGLYYRKERTQFVSLEVRKKPLY